MLIQSFEIGDCGLFCHWHIFELDIGFKEHWQNGSLKVRSFFQDGLQDFDRAGGLTGFECYDDQAKLRGGVRGINLQLLVISFFGFFKFASGLVKNTQFKIRI